MLDEQQAPLHGLAPQAVTALQMWTVTAVMPRRHSNRKAAWTPSSAMLVTR
jgi:hypothetical protein